MTKEEKIRAEFEKHLGFVPKRTESGEYLYAEASNGWNVWQAALATRPDVNQELVEALELFIEAEKGNGWHLLDKSCIERIAYDSAKQALAKHKAGESAGFTEKDLVNTISMAIKESSINEDYKNPNWLEIRSKAIITALSQCGALNIKKGN